MAWLASLIGKKKPKRPLWRRAATFLTVNQTGRLMLLATILVVLWLLTSSYLLEDVYPVARDDVLRSVGFGFYPLVAWVAVTLAALRLSPRWLLRWWRWWLATGLLVTAAQAALGGVHGAQGILAEATLGGQAGQALWGASLLRGIPTVGGLTLLAGIILSPRSVYRIARVLLRALVIALLISLLRLWRWSRWSVRLGGRTVWAVMRALARATQRRRESATGPAAPYVPEVLDDSLIAEQLQPEPPEPGPTYATDPEDEADHVLPYIQETPAQPATPQEQAASYAGRGWTLPSLDLLEHGLAASITEEQTALVAHKIEEALSHHGVQVTVDQIKPGPTVTLYGLTPGWSRRFKEVKERDEDGNLLRDTQGKQVVNRVEEQTRVKVDSILAREKDLALSLAAPSLRIQAPVPGESVVGIEVPNRNPVLVTLRGVLEAPAFQDIVGKGGLALALGQGSGGDPAATDLRQLPHLLIAGATGSGKSVCINAIIASMVTQVPPSQVRLLLIDPKRVELTPFNGLPHLLTPVVVDTEPAVRTLKGMLREMFRRYRRMEELGVRNIEGYRRHPQALEPMPYLVIAIDELADLMMSAPYDIEQTICRLAQLGRATGIHLIVATQRPSVDVVTGLIKANFPSRISFAVVSNVDSRTILDSPGAERLLGKGDMLFLSSATPKPQRVQGAFVSDREIGHIMEFWRSQPGPPLPQIDLEPEPVESHDDTWEDGERSGSRDELLEKAVELASRYSHLSTSLLQRRMRIGYPRAARLMDQLEDEGIIGPGEQGKSREVLSTRQPQHPQQ